MIKQNIYFSFIFIIILTLGHAQKSVNQYDTNGKRHGIWTKNFHNTKQIRYVGEFNNGKEIDTFKYYTLANGKSVLSAIRVFNPNDSLADVTFYTSTKKIISSGKMNGKTYVGKWVYYHKNSNKEMIVEYYNTNGNLEGERKVFYETGGVAEVANYRAGKLEGESKWYSKSKKLLKHLNYKEDLLDGDSIYYGPGGNITSKGSYSKNRKVDVWQYFKDGKLVKEINHTTGEIIKKE